MGVNVTKMEHVAELETLVPQLLVCEKSPGLVPVIETETLVIVELVYPNTILTQQSPAQDIHMHLFKLSPAIFCVTLFTGFIAGIYPASVRMLLSHSSLI